MRSMIESWKLPFLAMVGLSMTLAVGCTSTEETKDDDVASAEVTETTEVTEEKVWKDPEVGMTQAEIIELYEGEPDSKNTSSDGGEVWTYHMNAGAAFIPWNFGYRPEYDAITFGPDGKVTSFVLGR